MNHLYYGDNLDILQRYIADESVDLVYLDPPFNSAQDYNVLFKEHSGAKAAAQIKAFGDTWTWDEEAARAYESVVESGARVADAMRAFKSFLGTSDMMAYLAMMAPRLVELHRVMKPTASIYLHCDPTASHYLKMVLDAIFGPQNFRNEIIWKRHNARSTDKRWPRVHDTILMFSKSEVMNFEPTLVPGDKTKIPHTLITVDGLKYQTYELTGAGTTKEGESGKPWKGFDPSKMGRHWANTSTLMDEWDAAGLIHWPKVGSAGGFPRRRDSEPFIEGDRLVTVGDVWNDIDRINQAAKERLGYPTQKPLALLERIVRASTLPGDVVLDPFCGCGTAIAAAEGLGRQWIGVDITHLAIGLIKSRLRDAFGAEIVATYKVVGEPTTIDDAAQLAEDDKFQFQAWALGLVGARVSDSAKKGADKGIDGRLFFHDEPTGGKTKQIIISVKGGGTSVKDVRDLRGVIEREKAEIGVLISLEAHTKPMRQEAADAGFYHSPWNETYPRLQLLTIEEILGGKTISYPSARQTNVTLKKAPKSKSTPEKQGTIF